MLLLFAGVVALQISITFIIIMLLLILFARVGALQISIVIIIGTTTHEKLEAFDGMLILYHVSNLMSA